MCIRDRDNGPVLTYTYGFHQFNTYVTKSNHSFASAVVAFNPAKWDSLSAEQQEILQTAATQYAEDVKVLAREDVDEMSQLMVDEGCNVIEPTDPVSYTHLDVYKRQMQLRAKGMTFF